MISEAKLKVRREIDGFFRRVALEENQKNQKTNFSDLLLKNDKKHFLLVCKEAAGDIFNASSLLESLRQSYPQTEWNIYFACDPQYFDLIDGCQYIDKVVPYQQFMESEIACIGAGETKGMFNGYCFLTTDTQRFLSYLTNHNVSLKLT